MSIRRARHKFRQKLGQELLIDMKPAPSVIPLRNHIMVEMEAQRRIRQWKEKMRAEMEQKKKRLTESGTNTTDKILLLPKKALLYLITGPISTSIFRDPVYLSDGYVYEREMITEWLIKHNTSPMTTAVVAKRLIPAYGIKSLVRMFLQANPEYADDQYGP